MIETFTIVGGASAYTPGLVRALIHHADRLALDEVRLFDIDAQRLEVVAPLCRAMAEANGSPFEVTATTDKAEAVDGIDALLNSSRPGGFECRRIDETLPLEFGIPGQETVGPGGFFFALRSIPEALDLARHVRKRSPEAIWLNYTNPTNIVGQVLHDQTELEVLTLCDQSDEDIAAIARVIGRGDTECNFECIGLNHATWYDDVTIDGREIPNRAFEADPPRDYDEEHKLRFRLSQRFAIVNDGRWPNSYLPYYFEPEKFVELSRQVGPRTDAIVEKLDGYYRHFEREAEKEDPELERHRGDEGFGDMAVDVLAALESEQPLELVLNVPNRGMSDLFADDTLIEVRVGLDSEGVHARRQPEVPDGQEELLAQLETYQRRTAKAAVDPSQSSLVEALASNPLVGDPDLARRLLDRAENAYGSQIPIFA